MTFKEQMLQCFQNALKYNQQFIAVVVELPEGNEELIVNRRASIMDKIRYYDENYDDDLVKKNNPNIKIVTFTSGNSLFAIESDLFE